MALLKHHIPVVTITSESLKRLGVKDALEKAVTGVGIKKEFVDFCLPVISSLIHAKTDVFASLQTDNFIIDIECEQRGGVIIRVNDVNRREKQISSRFPFAHLFFADIQSDGVRFTLAKSMIDRIRSSADLETFANIIRAIYKSRVESYAYFSLNHVDYFVDVEPGQRVINLSYFFPSNQKQELTKSSKAKTPPKKKVAFSTMNDRANASIKKTQ